MARELPGGRTRTSGLRRTVRGSGFATGSARLERRVNHTHPMPMHAVLLDGAIDIYLPDLKFGPAVGPGSCGERVGGMPDYWNVVTGCIARLHGEGRRLLVRHLLMPGHFDCCTRPALTWLAMLPDIEVSLLTQYVAPPQARGELAGELAAAEVTAARELAAELGLKLAV